MSEENIICDDPHSVIFFVLLFHLSDLFIFGTNFEARIPLYSLDGWSTYWKTSNTQEDIVKHWFVCTPPPSSRVQKSVVSIFERYKKVPYTLRPIWLLVIWLMIQYTMFHQGWMWTSTQKFSEDFTRLYISKATKAF